MDFLLFFSRMLKLLNVLFLIFIVAANILVLIQIVPGSNSVARVMQIILRIYNILFSLVVIIAIFGSVNLFKMALFLQDWKGVGLTDILYAF